MCRPRPGDTLGGMGIPAVVTAGDRGAAKAIQGESKVFLPIEGRALVAWVVLELQQVPEVSEVWVVGDSARLAEALGDPAFQAALEKPLHVIEQFQNLYENAWQAYRRALPRSGTEGRDPASAADEDVRVLYLSGDLPFATAHEISDFVRKAVASGCEYALGLVTEDSMRDFAPEGDEAEGVEMATFNLREGRYRQSNLHLAQPARIRNRDYIQSMYEHRHQKELGQIFSLAWQLLRHEKGGLAVVWYYGLMHLAGVADRRGWKTVADLVRAMSPMARIERGCGELLKTEFRFIVTEVGGCAVDIDNEHDYAVACERFSRWRAAQRTRAEQVVGPLLPAGDESAEQRG